MAGTLTIDTLQDGSSNSSSVTDVVKGSARAWVNFNGTGTVAIRDSYNVSSITDNSTGYYTANFTNAMSNTNYVAVFNGHGQCMRTDTYLTSSVSALSFYRDDTYTPADILTGVITVHGN